LNHKIASLWELNTTETKIFYGGYYVKNMKVYKIDIIFIKKHRFNVLLTIQTKNMEIINRINAAMIILPAHWLYLKV